MADATESPQMPKIELKMIVPMALLLITRQLGILKCTLYKKLSYRF